MKEFNITAQGYNLNDPNKQHLFINHVFISDSSENAIDQFKNLYSPSIGFHIVKIHSAEEIFQGVA